MTKEFCDICGRPIETQPTLAAMTSYLRRHKSEWYNPALETEKRDANKKSYQ